MKRRNDIQRLDNSAQIEILGSILLFEELKVFLTCSMFLILISSLSKSKTRQYGGESTLLYKKNFNLLVTSPIVCRLYKSVCNEFNIHGNSGLENKRGSRGAARAAKSLRWSV